MLFSYNPRMRTVTLRPELREELAGLAVAAYPHEGCGVLLGDGTGDAIAVRAVATCANRADNPRREFLLDPEDYLAAERRAEATGQQVVGIWHSHPEGTAEPSRTDLEMAWGGWSYLIAATRADCMVDLRAWRLNGAGFVEEVIES
ncbi:proteasome lid subunit RPN8/RPN11 [Natronocella acetinitrilica]|uniref:Proteasome lid subunit RPN8/RPN11 n=2 Tax=Natronocella acetinitrilica TaxID=414046 RepID=A0AAE3G234_9GAMM|nr:proteasome lid subunit RPN8/RPN11 [Natronocella acetinitrilica]